MPVVLYRQESVLSLHRTCLGLKYFKQICHQGWTWPLSLTERNTRDTSKPLWGYWAAFPGPPGGQICSAGRCFLSCFWSHSACTAGSHAGSCGNVLVICFALPWLSHLSVSGTGVAAGGDLRPWRGLKLSHLETPKRRTWDPKVALQTSTLNESVWRSIQFPAPRLWLASAIYQGKARVSALWSPLLCIK